jgi:hypothetical protein
MMKSINHNTRKDLKKRKLGTSIEVDTISMPASNPRDTKDSPVRSMNEKEQDKAGASSFGGSDGGTNNNIMATVDADEDTDDEEEEVNKEKDKEYNNSSTNHIVVTKLRPNDVLLGRGAHANSYQGNVKYRDFIRYWKTEYSTTSKRQMKHTIASEIVTSVLCNNGRFLRPNVTILDTNTNSSSNSSTTAKVTKKGTPYAIPTTTTATMTNTAVAAVASNEPRSNTKENWSSVHTTFDVTEWIIVPRDVAIEKTKQALRDLELSALTSSSSSWPEWNVGDENNTRHEYNQYNYPTARKVDEWGQHRRMQPTLTETITAPAAAAASSNCSSSSSSCYSTPSLPSKRKEGNRRNEEVSPPTTRQHDHDRTKKKKKECEGGGGVSPSSKKEEEQQQNPSIDLSCLSTRSNADLLAALGMLLNQRPFLGAVDSNRSEPDNVLQHQQQNMHQQVFQQMQQQLQLPMHQQQVPLIPRLPSHQYQVQHQLQQPLQLQQSLQQKPPIQIQQVPLQQLKQQQQQQSLQQQLQKQLQQQQQHQQQSLQLQQPLQQHQLHHTTDPTFAAIQRQIDSGDSVALRTLLNPLLQLSSSSPSPSSSQRHQRHQSSVLDPTAELRQKLLQLQQEDGNINSQWNISQQKHMTNSIIQQHQNQQLQQIQSLISPTITTTASTTTPRMDTRIVNTPTSFLQESQTSTSVNTQHMTPMLINTLLQQYLQPPATTTMDPIIPTSTQSLGTSLPPFLRSNTTSNNNTTSNINTHSNASTSPSTTVRNAVALALANAISETHHSNLSEWATTTTMSAPPITSNPASTGTTTAQQNNIIQAYLTSILPPPTLHTVTNSTSIGSKRRMSDIHRDNDTVGVTAISKKGTYKKKSTKR